jgi:hypothetical protein
MEYIPNEKTSGSRKRSGSEETGNEGGKELEDETGGNSGISSMSSSRSDGDRVAMHCRRSESGGKRDSARCKILSPYARGMGEASGAVASSVRPPANRRFFAEKKTNVKNRE